MRMFRAVIKVKMIRTRRVLMKDKRMTAEKVLTTQGYYHLIKKMMKMNKVL